MILSQYVIWFSLFAFLGWVFECAYNVVKLGVWENRGFLFGPICPIYGAGVVAALIAFDHSFVTTEPACLVVVFFASMVGSAVLEYATSVVLERLFDARWWDYSDMPLNVNGRICLPASLLFGIAGVAVVVFLIPAVHWVDATVPPLLLEAVALVLVALLAVDATLAVSSLTQLMDSVKRYSQLFDQMMEANRQGLSDSISDMASRLPDAPTIEDIKAKLPDKQTLDHLKDKLPDREALADKLPNTPSLDELKSRLPDAPTLDDLRAHLPLAPKLEDLQGSARNFAEGLTDHQRRVLRSVRKFTATRASDFVKTVQDQLLKHDSEDEGKR